MSQKEIHMKKVVLIFVFLFIGLSVSAQAAKIKKRLVRLAM